jgi:hypothetical protein
MSLKNIPSFGKKSQNIIPDGKIIPYFDKKYKYSFVKRSGERAELISVLLRIAHNTFEHT